MKKLLLTSLVLAFACGCASNSSTSQSAQNGDTSGDSTGTTVARTGARAALLHMAPPPVRVLGGIASAAEAAEKHMAAKNDPSPTPTP